MSGSKDGEKVKESSLIAIPLKNAKQEIVTTSDEKLERRFREFEERVMSAISDKMLKLCVSSLPTPTPLQRPEDVKDKPASNKKNTPKEKKTKAKARSASSGCSFDALQQAMQVPQPQDSEDEETDEDEVCSESQNKRDFGHLSDQDLFVSFAAVIKEHGSVQMWVDKRTWNQGRTYREAHALSRVIDAMLKERLDSSSRALGLALRRLTGIQLADYYNDWNICDVVEQHSPGNTPLDIKQVGTILKQAQHIAKFASHRKTSTHTWKEKHPQKKDKFFKKQEGEKKQAPSTSGGGGANQK